MVPFADLLIGATALSLGYSVLTVNARHFGRIPGLSVQRCDGPDGSVESGLLRVDSEPVQGACRPYSSAIERFVSDGENSPFRRIDQQFGKMTALRDDHHLPLTISVVFPADDNGSPKQDLLSRRRSVRATS